MELTSAKNVDAFSQIINSWNGVSFNCDACGVENIS